MSLRQDADFWSARMAFLGKLAHADAIAVVLEVKNEGFVTYAGDNIPLDPGWNGAIVGPLLRSTLDARRPGQGGVVLPLADGRAASSIFVAPIVWSDQLVGALVALRANGGFEERDAAEVERLADLVGLELAEATALRRAQSQQLELDTRLRAQAKIADVARSTRDPDELLEQTEQLLDGRRTYNRRTLGERYDRARAELAGTWILARGDAGQELPELDVFVLTHSEREYSPAAAAVRAVELAHSAEAALAVAEQTALTDFVIGRLPSAIGIAWTRMHDWKSEVNAKMRTAESSSGVGVQVQVDLSQDLPPSIRTVHELSCRVGDADRTETQKAEVGGAIQALLAAADGDTMVEKLTVAVDIREWVDVHYVVTRPDRDGGQTSGRWNSRTGLSGGERRLVVLAPMLAAIAAAYDRLGPTGLRLVPLDEVPVEVDERGREGLARYIAELDLDLVCTSYLWDGAPGAWDGIDAHDLEAAPDGTVVAFPMLIRGLEPLPGEADETS